MKLRILILSIFGTFIFNSCSNDNNSSNSTSQNLDPNTILPKKVIIDRYSSSDTYEIFYIQNKIDYILYSTNFNNQPLTYEINFTYDGDLISHISIPNFIDEVFTYQNNQLIQVVKTKNYWIGPEPTTETTTENYVYDSNGRVTITSGNTQDTYTLINGLVESLYNSSNFNTGSITLTYYYSSYSPFKNVLGIDKIYFIPNQGIIVDEYEGILNHGLYDLFLLPKNISTIEGNNPSKFTYTYNNILFPTSITKHNRYFNIYQIKENYNIFYE